MALLMNILLHLKSYLVLLISIPFGYDRSTLILNGLPYTNSSHFKLLFDNLFMCSAMWLGFSPLLDLEESNNYNYVSVTSIYSLYIHKLRRVSKNINVKKNDFSSQECYLLKTIKVNVTG